MEDLKKRFKRIYPNTYFLDYSVRDLDVFLRDRGWILPGEKITTIEIPGEGNMNCVLRVITDKRSFILKQARPWVEKYPHIGAPVERNAIEAKYYAYVNQVEHLHAFSPDMAGIDDNHFIMVLSDLGRGTDYSFLYRKKKKLNRKELKAILQYLIYLHDLRPGDFPSNAAMRALNHEHIFVFPFSEENDFDLDIVEQGLQLISMSFKKDSFLKNKIRTLGKLYLSEGTVLVHGDYFPGSWLKTQTGLKVIDPEFSFTGYAEFDIGVLIAHMQLAEQDEAIMKAIVSEFRKTCNMRLVAGFAGTEILRRLLGVAQLPLSLSLKEKKSLAEQAKGMIINQKMDIS